MNYYSVFYSAVVVFCCFLKLFSCWINFHCFEKTKVRVLCCCLWLVSAWILTYRQRHRVSSGRITHSKFSYTSSKHVNKSQAKSGVTDLDNTVSSKKSKTANTSTAQYLLSTQLQPTKVSLFSRREVEVIWMKIQPSRESKAQACMFSCYKIRSHMFWHLFIFRIHWTQETCIGVLFCGLTRETKK